MVKQAIAITPENAHNVVAETAGRDIGRLHQML